MIIAGFDLSKTYHGRKVLDQVSISCAAGEICGLLGANGAGKTTLFKILFGLVTPDSGTVEIKTSSKKKIGGIIEGPALYDYLSAQENIRLFGSIQGLDVSRQNIDLCLSNVGLPLDRKDPVRNFSLDEPFSGLDPLGVAALRKLIVDLAEQEQLAIILSSHIIEELSKICHTLYVIKDGKMVNRGPAQKLITDNTTTYSVCANNITSSKILNSYDVVWKGQCAHVTVTADRVPELIHLLHQEGIYITSCTPELSMEKLFEISN
jgi:ABC-2 type transport system ATP-binding protein